MTVQLPPGSWQYIDESRFNLWDRYDRIRVRRYAGERCLPECVIEPHSGLTPEVMVWGAISYHGQYNLLEIEEDGSKKRKTTREANDAVIDLYLWFAQTMSKRELISGPMLCEKALELNEKLGGSADFKGQNEGVQRYSDNCD
ncbi:uncharacterized protein TNCV_2133571 [Trichonephila clavipes]|nr:uncharacterized protein TNCV_2133571 [Trichonephila clavipes]